MSGTPAQRSPRRIRDREAKGIIQLMRFYILHLKDDPSPEMNRQLWDTLLTAAGKLDRVIEIERQYPREETENTEKES